MSEHQKAAEGSKSAVQRLDMLRKQTGLSQSALAKIAGITPSALSMIEAGKREPSLATAISLADALNITLDMLAGRSVYPHNEFTIRGELIKAQQKLAKIRNLAT